MIIYRKKLVSANNNITPLANVAYQGVNLMPREDLGEEDYEDPQMIPKPEDDLADRSEIITSTAEGIYETISTSQPAAENNSNIYEAVYATVASATELM